MATKIELECDLNATFVSFSTRWKHVNYLNVKTCKDPSVRSLLLCADDDVGGRFCTAQMPAKLRRS